MTKNTIISDNAQPASESAKAEALYVPNEFYQAFDKMRRTINDHITLHEDTWIVPAITQDVKKWTELVHRYTPLKSTLPSSPVLSEQAALGVIREQFENWLTGEGEWPHLKYKNFGGSYITDEACMKWDAYKAGVKAALQNADK